MPKFSQQSIDKLNTCHPNIQKVFKEVIKYFDCTILCGQRTQSDQNTAFAEGKSKLKFPQSKHNSSPSDAIDAVPCPIDWNDKERFCYFAGMVKGIAEVNNIKLRWGGDWDFDTQRKDQTFDDLPHFELN